MNLSKEQREIVEAPLDERTVVMATAASGKTHTATQRLVHVLEQGVPAEEVVLVTFTNNAAAEMANRVPVKLRKGLFVGTMHSYANLLLNSCGIRTGGSIRNEGFDELFELVYENPRVVRKVSYLIVDEAQDLNSLQFDFIEMLNATGCLIVGDVRQSIYGFREATPERLLSMIKDTDTYTVRELSENYRNAEKILELSNEIVRKMKGISLTTIRGRSPHVGTVQYIRKRDIISLIRRHKEWKDWAILCRANRTVDNMLDLLRRNNIPTVTFKQADGDLSDLQEQMSKNAVKVLTVHSSKGLEFERVIIVDQYSRAGEALRINYVAVTRAKEYLYMAVL